VAGVGDLGEMHVRGGAYVGIAPVGADIVNVCAVTTPRPGAGRPMDVIRQAIASASLSPRFERAAFVGEPAVLGPLAVDVAAAGIEGLLLAGDAAGFVDPMTGDGLSLAMRGAVLAAQEAIHALDTSDLAGAPARLGEARRRALGPKVRFNRLVRRVSSSPAAVLAAGCSALVAPGLLARAIKYAGT
jgi:flavin-dependent dehydrogenase